MPHTLRRIVVLALSMCALAVSGISPAAASVDLGRAKPIAAHHTSKKKVTVCDKAAQLRRAVIKKYVKLYTRQFGKKKGKAMGRDKPGRDICRIGLRGGKKPGSPRKVRYYWTLHRLRYPPPPPPEPVASSQPVSSQPTASAAPAGSGGKYCGYFQFDQGTWESVGGSGSPCAASPDEQWRRASKLHQLRGNQPWPKCGRNGASLEAIMRCESSGSPTAVGG
jgi:hypothetical protein